MNMVYWLMEVVRLPKKMPVSTPYMFSTWWKCI